MLPPKRAADASTTCRSTERNRQTQSVSCRCALLILRQGMSGASRRSQPSGSLTLLARSQARSDDVEADGLQPLVAPAVHPFTGTFAASEHTVAFGSKAFRLAFPLHVVAMALLFFPLCIHPSSGAEYFFLLLLALALGARIALHCWTCHARAQRFGAIAWTIIVACGCTADYVAYGLSTEPACEIPSMEVYPCFPNGGLSVLP